MRALLPSLLLAPALALAEAPAFVAPALEQAAPGTRATVLEYRATLPAGCVAAQALATGPADGAGRVTLRLSGSNDKGARCEGFAAARAQFVAPAWVVTKALARGAPLDGSVAQEERPWSASRARVIDLTPNATAAAALAPGTVLEDRHVQGPGPHVGDKVTVVLKTGAVTLTQEGRLAPCMSGRSCATLPTGRKLEGRLVDGRLLVEAP